MAELSIKLKADIKELTKKLNQAERELKSLEKISTSSGKKIGGLGKTSAKGINTLSKSTANATPTLQEFSRVIQDAPFGIQGVANNITQLTSNFGHLQKSAGGTKQALKALVGTLTGPAGILLAVSAVTSLLVSYGDELFNTSQDADKLIEAQKDLVGSALAEVDTLNALLKVAKDEGKSKKDRQRAIDKINEDYGDYLGNLDLENIATDKVAKSVDKLSTSLVRQAKIKAISNLLSEKQAELFELENKSLSTQVGFFDALIAKSLNFGNTVGETGDLYKKAVKNQAEASKDLNKEITKLTESLQGLIDEDINVEGVFTKVNKKLSKVELTPTLDLAPTIKAEGLNQVVSDVSTEIEASLDGLTKQSYPDFINETIALQNQAELLASAVGSAFSAMTQQVTSSLQTGNAILDAFVASLIGGLAQIASSLLQQAILEKVLGRTKIATEQSKSSANAITIATNSAAALGPFGGIALPGLIAANLALVNGAFAGIQAFAKGGFSGDDNLAMLNRNELILRPMEQAALYNAIRGGNLGSLSNNVNRGTTTTQDEIVSVIRGSDLYLINKRAGKKQDRFYGTR